MDKIFVKVPEGRFERIMLSASLSEGLTGVKVTRAEMMETFDKEDITLTEEQKIEVDERFE